MAGTAGPADAGGERERTAAVPAGAWDAAAVAEAAREADPGLPPGVALALAEAAGRHLQGAPGTDAPALARRLLADDPGLGATPAAVVARAAVDAWSLAAADPV